ncbi:MAG: cell division ATP-binding protein FtsE [Alphaproteobacteria bacterium]|nr:cell division ATP-binding protein FtsE [Alphaproteobacteria bacterium]
MPRRWPPSSADSRSIRTWSRSRARCARCARGCADAPSSTGRPPRLDGGEGRVRRCPSSPASGPRDGRIDVIRFENVGMRYGNGPEVLRDLTFAVDPGAFWFLTGASGAGKSSLLRLMYLASAPSRGLINLFDRDIATTPRADLPSLRRQIGVVFQDFRLVPHLTARDNVALPLRIAGVAEAEIREHVTELLRWVGLGGYVDQFPPALSGGQQQRIAVARAVIARPRLLLADEPTGNLDEEMGNRLMHLFEELNKLGTSVVIATHNEGLVRRHGGRVLHLVDGELAEIRDRAP